MRPYKTFEECVRKNLDKEDPEAYCGAIARRVEHGKNVYVSPHISHRNGSPYHVKGYWRRW